MWCACGPKRLWAYAPGAAHVDAIGAEEKRKGTLGARASGVGMVRPVERARGEGAVRGRRRRIASHVPLQVGHRCRAFGDDDGGARAGESDAQKSAARPNLEAPHGSVISAAAVAQPWLERPQRPQRQQV